MRHPKWATSRVIRLGAKNEYGDDTTLVIKVTVREGATRDMVLETIKHLRAAYTALVLADDSHAEGVGHRTDYGESPHAYPRVNIFIMSKFTIAGEPFEINQFNEYTNAYSFVCAQRGIHGFDTDELADKDSARERAQGKGTE